MAHDDKWYLANEKPPSLYGWVFRHMAMGAVYAALALAAVIAVILILKAIGALLPEDPFALLDAAPRALSALV